MSFRLSYASEAAGRPYSLTLRNESASPFTFYVFQKAPDQETANIFSLAWFASPFTMMPNNRIRFEWSLTYDFVWGASGSLVPGLAFDAGGVIPANPDGANSTKFAVEPGPNLSEATSGNPAGSLVVNDSGDVPSHQFLVGIGMSGAGTLVTQAGPNLTHIFTMTTPRYWIGAGWDIRVGKVLEITTHDPVAEVCFPPNVYDLTYALSTQNQWEERGS